MTRTLGRALAILALASVAAAAHSLATPVLVGRAPAPQPARTHADPHVAPGAEPATTADPSATGADTFGPTINLAQAKALFDRGAGFLDARTLAEYEDGHIEGAFHVEAQDLSRSPLPEALNFLDPDGHVVVYCGGGNCHASENVATVLEGSLGFKNVHVMTDGYGAWAQAGHPTGAGPDPVKGAAP